jgi:hypothetical protein
MGMGKKRGDDMNEKALLRRLQRVDVQEKPARGLVGDHHLVPYSADTMRVQLQEESDRQRDCLATELLKIAAETGAVSPEGWTEAAKHALAAATIIHPELPDADPEEVSGV